jgi:hypothetical protein
MYDILDASKTIWAINKYLTTVAGLTIYLANGKSSKNGRIKTRNVRHKNRVTQQMRLIFACLKLL